MGEWSSVCFLVFKLAIIKGFFTTVRNELPPSTERPIVVIVIIIIISDCICSYSGVLNFEPQRRDRLF